MLAVESYKSELAIHRRKLRLGTRPRRLKNETIVSINSVTVR